MEQGIISRDRRTNQSSVWFNYRHITKKPGN